MKLARTLSFLSLALLLSCAPMYVAHASVGAACTSPSGCSANTETCSIPNGQTSGHCVSAVATIGGCTGPSDCPGQTCSIPNGQTTGTCVSSPTNTNTNTNTGSGLQNPLAGAGINSLPDLLNALLDFAVTIGGIVVVIMLVFVGFKFVAAQGNSEKLIEARTMLLWTVIGALILLGAKAIEVGIVATVNSIAS